MTPLEFVARYYLHDSSIEKVDFDADKKVLTLIIEFCFWMQEWYKKDEPTNGLIRVTFKDVSSFEYDDDIADRIFSDELDSEIRLGDYVDGNLIIVAVEYSEPEDIYYRLKIKAVGVEVEELSRYTL